MEKLKKYTEDLHSVMNISQYVIDSFAMVVNDVVIPLFVGIFVGIVVSIITYFIWMKKTKKNLIRSLLPEININQNRLQPLSDCVEKVLDCDNCEYSEIVTIPNKLHFDRTVYSNLLDKIGLLDYKIIEKLIRFYSETKDVEERYRKFEIIYGASHSFLNYVIVDSELKESLGQFNYDENNPGKVEIEEFLRHTKKVYDLGTDLIISMEENNGA